MSNTKKHRPTNFKTKLQLLKMLLVQLRPKLWHDQIEEMIMMALIQLKENVPAVLVACCGNDLG